jgi:hypothetical protein
MKTKVLFILMCMLSAALYSQTIQNNGFENWTMKTYYDEPDSFMTTNAQVYFMSSLPNVTKITDVQHGSFAAKLETVYINPDTAFGLMLIGKPITGGIGGGLPFTARPDSLIGYVKYNIMTNDTANIVVFFKKLGVMMGGVGKQFHGTAGSYTRFSLPITWYAPGQPDSLIAIITSSNLDYPKIPGSIFCVDNLYFKDSTAVVHFPNGDMEYWKAVTSEEPDNWTTINLYTMGMGTPSVTKDTDSYSGTYAIKCVNVPLLYGDTIGYFTNGTIGKNGPEGGMTTWLNPDKVTGYYKYLPVGMDTAIAGVMTYRYDGTLHKTIMLDSSRIKLKGAISYTYFEIPLTYNNWPWVDTANIAFASGNIDPPGSYVGLGSTLFIDNLQITYKPMGVTETLFGDKDIVIYPNPADEYAYVQINVPSASDYRLKVYDAYGKEVMEKLYSKNTTGSIYKIDLSWLPAGIYVFNIQTDQGLISKKVMVN